MLFKEMPRLTRLRRRTLRVLATTTVIVGAVPALAQACTVSLPNATTAFSQFGDLANYAPAPGGTFESGTSGWMLNGASVQYGNESFFVNSPTDSHSLVVPSTSEPISAPICVDSTTPTFRLFDRQVSGGWSQMNINVLWTDSSGVAQVTTAGGISPSTSWAPSQVINLGSMLPLWQPGSSLTVRLQFVPAVGGGSIAIDDVEIDPYSK
jgi:hypothetical protein